MNWRVPIELPSLLEIAAYPMKIAEEFDDCLDSEAHSVGCDGCCFDYAIGFGWELS